MSKRMANALLWALVGLVVALFLAFLGFAIYVKATYWNVPLGEVPSWALPFLK